MKKLYARWENFLTYPGARSQLSVVLCFGLVQAFSLALIHQHFTRVPFSTGIDISFILHWHWRSPFPISRLWDLFLGPAYLLLSEIVLGCEFFLDETYDGFVIEGRTNFFGTTTMIALTAGFLGGFVGGVFYVVVGVLVGLLLWVIFVLGWLIQLTILSVIYAMSKSRSRHSLGD